MVRLSRGSVGSRESTSPGAKAKASLVTARVSNKITRGPNKMSTKKERRMMAKSRPIVDKRVMAPAGEARPTDDAGAVAAAVRTAAAAAATLLNKKRKMQLKNKKKREKLGGADQMPTAQRLIKTNSSSLKQGPRQKVIASEITGMRDLLKDDAYQQDPTGTLLRMIQANMPKPK